MQSRLQPPFSLMETEKFVAKDITEALRLVKEKFGKNALILATKKVRKGTGAFGIFGKEMIEVTAAREYKYIKERHNQTQAASIPTANTTVPKAVYNRYGKPQSFEEEDEPLPTKVGWQSKPAATEELGEVKDLLHALNDKVKAPGAGQQQIGYMRQEIQELKSMLHSLVNGKEANPQADWNENLTALYQQLYFNNLEEKFARRIIEELKTKVSAANLEDYEYLKLYVARILMQNLTVDNLIEKNGSKPAIYAFLGVTGVGKTTSIAKIASQIKMLAPEKRIGLVTLDNYRIGAVEQLKEYAKIIRAPFRSVNNADELKSVLKSFREFDYILIDTPGASQRDEDKLGDTRSVLEVSASIQSVLVLNATTRDTELSEITKSFAQFKPVGCLFTKLDEASTYGSVMNHIIRFKLPLFFFTTGQNVPDDIELAKPERLIDLLIHLAS